MIDARCFIGEPCDYKGLCLIYPPKVKDVIANKEYNFYMQLLCLSQEELEDELTKNALAKGEELSMDIPTPFEFLMINCYHDKKIAEIAKRGFQLFIHEEVNFLFDQKAILIGNLAKELEVAKTVEDLRLINEANFFDFQNQIRAMSGLTKVEPPRPNEDIRVRRIKAKARYRDKIKAKKSAGTNLATTLVAICCMDCGINPLNIGELSYASVQALIHMYQQKEKYTLDIDSLLAGADSKKIKPKYWITEFD